MCRALRQSPVARVLTILTTADCSDILAVMRIPLSKTSSRNTYMYARSEIASVRSLSLYSICTHICSPIQVQRRTSSSPLPVVLLAGVVRLDCNDVKVPDGLRVDALVVLRFFDTLCELL